MADRIFRQVSNILLSDAVGPLAAAAAAIATKLIAGASLN